MGNVDNSSRFTDCYLAMLGLGQAYDFFREDKLRSRTLMRFSLNPSIAMAMPIGFDASVSAENHSRYAALAGEDWSAQTKCAVAMFSWESAQERSWVWSQLQDHGADQLQYFEQLELESLPAGRNFNSDHRSGVYRNAHLRRSSSGWCMVHDAWCMMHGA